MGPGGHHLGTPPLSAVALGPLPQQPHRPTPGISAIKVVGVASFPELGPPLPRSARGGTSRSCLALKGGWQGALPPASKEQRAGPGAGAHRGLLPAVGLQSLRSKTPEPPSRHWFVMEPLCFSVLCAPHPHDYCVIRECRLSGVGNLLGFFPTIMALSVLVFSVFQPVR